MVGHPTDQKDVGISSLTTPVVHSGTATYLGVDPREALADNLRLRHDALLDLSTVVFDVVSRGVSATRSRWPSARAQARTGMYS